jgi:hypothetical protein
MSVEDTVQQELIAEEKAEVFLSIGEYLNQAIIDLVYDDDIYDAELANGDASNWTYNKLRTIEGLIASAEKAGNDLLKLARPTFQDVVNVAYNHSAEVATAELIAGGQTVNLGAGWEGISEYAVDALVDGLVNRWEKRVDKLAITSSVQNEATDYIERIASQVVGGRALNDAQAEAVSELIDKGIPIFKDSKGRKWAIENYAPMYVRTASQQARVQGALDTYEASGNHLVYISDSPAECKYCRKYEGKIFRTTDNIADLPKSRQEDPPLHLNTAKNAKPVGLFHPNCTHQALLYIEGLTDLDKQPDPKDAEREKNRSNLKRVQKNKRRARAKMKEYKRKGQTAYYKNAKANWNKWLSQEKQLMSYFERQGLGWIGGNDRSLLLAEMLGVDPKEIAKLQNNPLALAKLAPKTAFPTKLVTPKARDAIADIIRPPDISNLRLDDVEQLSRQGQLAFKSSGLKNIGDFVITDFTYLNESIQKQINFQYYKYFESDYGVFKYAENLNLMHAPPKLPSSINSKVKFDAFVNEGGVVSNKYAYWQWHEGDLAPTKYWQDDRKTNLWDKIVERKLAEEVSAGAKTNRKQYVSGGLPSSGKSRTISGKDPNKAVKTIDLAEYVTLNSDDMKTMLLIEEYGTTADIAIHDEISDLFINSDTNGVNTIIKLDSAGNIIEGQSEVWAKLKKSHPDVFDTLFAEYKNGQKIGYKETTRFNEKFLTEIKESIAERVVVVRTTDVVSEIIGFEGANIVHSESSALLAYAQDRAGERGLNIVHDVTLGSDKPLDKIDELIKTHGYMATEGTYIVYQAEQAKKGVVQRYAEGNFQNLTSKVARGRGGRYVSTGVIDEAMKLIETDAVNETLEILGRPAINDNEIYMARLLKSGNVDFRDNGFQIIDRTLIDENTGYPVSRKILLQRGKDGIQGIKKVNPSTKNKGLDLLDIVQEDTRSRQRPRVTKVKVKAELPKAKYEKSAFKGIIDKYKTDFRVLKNKDGYLTKIQMYFDNLSGSKSYVTTVSTNFNVENAFGDKFDVNVSTGQVKGGHSRRRFYRDLSETIDDFRLNEFVDDANLPIGLSKTRTAKDYIVKSIDEAQLIINSETDNLLRNHHLYIVPTVEDAHFLFNSGIAPSLIYVGDSKVFEKHIDIVTNSTHKRLRNSGYPNFRNIFHGDDLPIRYSPNFTDGFTVSNLENIPAKIGEADLVHYIANTGKTDDFDAISHENLFKPELSEEFKNTVYRQLEVMQKQLADNGIEHGAIKVIYSIDAVAFYKSALDIPKDVSFIDELLAGNIDPYEMYLAGEQYKNGQLTVTRFTNESSGMNRAVVKLKQLLGMNYQTTHNLYSATQQIKEAQLGSVLVSQTSTVAKDDVKDIFELTRQSLTNERYIDAETGQSFLYSVVGKHINTIDADGDMNTISTFKVAQKVTEGKQGRHVTDFLNLKTKRVVMTVDEFIEQQNHIKIDTDGDVVTKKAKVKGNTKKQFFSTSDNPRESKRLIGAVGNTKNNNQWLNNVDQDTINELQIDKPKYETQLINNTTDDFVLIEKLKQLNGDDLIEVVLVDEKDFVKNFRDATDNPYADDITDFLEGQVKDTTQQQHSSISNIGWADDLDKYIYGQGNREGRRVTTLRGDNLRLNTNIPNVSETDFDGLHKVEVSSEKALDTLALQQKVEGHDDFLLQNSAKTTSLDSNETINKKVYKFVKHEGVEFGTTQATSTKSNVKGKKAFLNIIEVPKEPNVKTIYHTVEIDIDDLKQDIRDGMFSVTKNDLHYYQDGGDVTDVLFDRDIEEFKSVKAIRKVIPQDVLDTTELGELLFSVNEEAYYGDTAIQRLKKGLELESMLQFSEDMTLRDMVEIRLNRNTDYTQHVIKAKQDGSGVNFIGKNYNRGVVKTQDPLVQQLIEEATLDYSPADMGTRQVDANRIFKDRLISKAVDKGLVSNELKQAVDIVDTVFAKVGGVNNLNLTQAEFVDLLEQIEDIKDETLADKIKIIDGKEILELQLSDSVTEQISQLIDHKEIAPELFDYDEQVYRIVIDTGEDIKPPLHHTGMIENYIETGNTTRAIGLYRSVDSQISRDILRYNVDIDTDTLLNEIDKVTNSSGFSPNKNELVAKLTTTQDIVNTLTDGINTGEYLNINETFLNNVADFGLVVDAPETALYNTHKLAKFGHRNLFNSSSIPMDIVIKDLETFADLGLVSQEEILELKNYIEYTTSTTGVSMSNKYFNDGRHGVNLALKHVADVTDDVMIQGFLIDEQLKAQAPDLPLSKHTLVQPLTYEILEGSQQKNTKLVVAYGNEVGSDLLDLDNKTYTEKLIVSEKGDLLTGINLEDQFNTGNAYERGESVIVNVSPTREADTNLVMLSQVNQVVGVDASAPSSQMYSAVVNATHPQGSEIQLGSLVSTSANASTAYSFSNSQLNRNLVLSHPDGTFTMLDMPVTSTIAEYNLANTASVRHISRLEGEYEYIVPSDAKLEVLGSTAYPIRVSANDRTIDLSFSEQQFEKTVDAVLDTSDEIMEEKKVQYILLDRLDNYSNLDSDNIPFQTFREIHTRKQVGGVVLDKSTFNPITTYRNINVVDLEGVDNLFDNQVFDGDLPQSFNEINMGSKDSAIQIVRALTSDKVIANIEYAQSLADDPTVFDFDLLVAKLKQARGIAENAKGAQALTIQNYFATQLTEFFSYYNDTAGVEWYEADMPQFYNFFFDNSSSTLDDTILELIKEIDE